MNAMGLLGAIFAVMLLVVLWSVVKAAYEVSRQPSAGSQQPLGHRGDDRNISGR